MTKRIFRMFALLCATVITILACACSATYQTKITSAPTTTAATTESKETTTEKATESTKETEESTKATEDTTKAIESTTEATTEATTESTTESATESTTESSKAAIDEKGEFTSKEDVALYIHTYGHLPSNFVTKKDARARGWEGGSLDEFYPGCSIGGDVFGNREGLLPEKNGRKYYECDIGTKGKKSRGAKRIVYSNDGLIYYTDDHYETFTLLYGEA